MRRSVAAISLGAMVLAAGACIPPAAQPGASTMTVGGPAGVRVEFAGAAYTAFGAQPEPADPVDGTLLVIPLEALAGIGSAVEADPAVFPDTTVFAIRNVNPRDAIVMFDRSTESPEMLVLTRDGRSPTVVPGLCDYYADPGLRRCHGEVTQVPG